MTDSKLRWQCRRGMRELDELLLRYLEHGYPGAAQADKRAFEALLDLPDPVLAAYLLQHRQPESHDLARVVRCLQRGIAPG